MVVENSGARRSRHCGNGGRSARTDLGETEVENLGLAAGGHKNIGWLDVAVDDAFGVRGVQRVGHLAPQVQKQVQRERAARDAITDRKSTRLNSSHTVISYAVFCLKKKNKNV